VKPSSTPLLLTTSPTSCLYRSTEITDKFHIAAVVMLLSSSQEDTRYNISTIHIHTGGAETELLFLLSSVVGDARVNPPHLKRLQELIVQKMGKLWRESWLAESLSHEIERPRMKIREEASGQSETWKLTNFLSSSSSSISQLTDSLNSQLLFQSLERERERETQQLSKLKQFSKLTNL